MNTRRSVRRRDAAWLVGGLWLLSFVVLPALHLVGHRNDHSHPAGSVLFHGLHAHDDGVVHDDAAPGHLPTLTTIAVGHEAGGLAHLAAVLLLGLVLVMALVIQRSEPLVSRMRSAWQKVAQASFGARAPPLPC